MFTADLKNVSYIISRVFAWSFYRDNATLFLLFLAFAFGFLKGEEHIALASYFVSSFSLMGIPIVTWLLYTIFVMDSNRKQSRRNENQFLADLFLYPRIIQWKSILWASWLQLLPILAYALFLVKMALQNHFYVTAMMALLAPIFLLILVSYRLRYTAKPVINETRSFRFSLHRSIPRPLIFIPIENIFRRQLLATLGYKSSAILLLFGTLQLYRHETYDIRLLGLAILISFTLSVQFILEWHQFDNTVLTLLRQLPFSWSDRLRKTMATILCYCIPEIILIQISFPENLAIMNRISVVAYGLSILFLFHTFLYTWNKPLEKVMSPLYFFVIGSFLLILCKIPLLLLMSLQFMGGVWIYRRYYYQYDYMAK